MIIQTKESITGLIITAGKSSRMGKFKPLMKYAGTTFIHRVVSRLDSVCQQIIVVTGYNSARLKSETLTALKNHGQETVLSKLRFVENTHFERGMFTSLQKGLNEIINGKVKGDDTKWVIYHFVDQPGLSADFYSDFMNQLENTYNWIQPSYEGHKGHPILIKNDLFDIILQKDPSATLKEVSMNPSVKKKIWNCSYRNILQDLDTPDDLNSDSEN